MKININNYDLVITSEKGCIRVYEQGHEIQGLTKLSYEAETGELQRLEIKQIITDKNGNYYFAGGEKKEKEKENE